jgi:hypothetical protein
MSFSSDEKIINIPDIGYKNDDGKIFISKKDVGEDH